MKKMMITIMLLAGLLVTSAQALCPSTNSCPAKPTPLQRPFAEGTQEQVIAWNRRVTQYNTHYNAYVACMRDYIRACRAEVDTLQNEIEDNVRRINRAVDEVNSTR